MITIPSQRLQTRFGEISDIVKNNEPVVVTQYGKPTMMLISYDDELMELMRQYYAQKAIKFLEERAKQSQRATDEELDEISRLIEEEREIVYQEKLESIRL